MFKPLWRLDEQVNSIVCLKQQLHADTHVHTLGAVELARRTMLAHPAILLKPKGLELLPARLHDPFLLPSPARLFAFGEVQLVCLI